MRALKYWIVLLVAGPSPAFSTDRVETESVNQEQAASIEAFLRANPKCFEFNDQCSFCLVCEGRAECSTPQIACIKQPYRCTAQ